MGAAQHDQPQAPVADRLVQGLPGRLGHGVDGDVVQHHGRDAVQAVGGAGKLPGGNPYQRQATGPQALRQWCRALGDVEQGQGAFDIDHGLAADLPAPGVADAQLQAPGAGAVQF